jgi:sugar lactone lactonase YvrE
MNCLTTNKYKLGESPIWNYFNDTLFWVDIDGYKIVQFDDKKVVEHNIFDKPTSLGLIDGTKLFVTVQESCGIYDMRSREYLKLREVDKMIIKGTRLNDGKTDRKGRYWISSKDLDGSNQIGSLFMIADNKFIPIFGQVGIGNGLAFSKDNNIMYFSDSLVGTITKFELNDIMLTNSKIIYQSNLNKSIVPDGGTVDCNDTYYSAIWGGYTIQLFDNMNSEIHVPTKYVTSVAFGGVNYDRLFVTSAMDSTTNIGGEIYYQKHNINGVREVPVNISSFYL